MEDRGNHDLAGRWVLPLLMLATACAAFYRDSHSASDLAIVPDSVEYAVAAHHLVSDGRYNIVVNGRNMPPRYQPWFSLLVLSPAYLLVGPEPGNAVFPVAALAVLGVLAAFRLGRHLGGDLGGVLAALALVSLPLYRLFAREVMTDVPCAALLLLLCLLYVRLQADSAGKANERNAAVYGAAGLLAALCAAIRPPFVCAVIPFLFAAAREQRESGVLPLHEEPGSPSHSGPPRRHACLCCGLVLLPCLAVIAGSMACNAALFGSVSRSGYHFWCPVPYDFPGLTLSPRHLAPNLRALAVGGPGPLIVLAAVIALYAGFRPALAATRQRAVIRQMLLFTSLTCLPPALFHLAYFFPDARFFLPPAALLLVTAAGAIPLLTAARSRLPAERTADHDSPWNTRLAGFIAACAFTAALSIRFAIPDHQPARRIAADRICDNTPQNALIVSAIDPAYLEFMVCRSTRRRVLPVSRRVEYASKVAAPERVRLSPGPKHWTDFDRAALLAAGAFDPVPAVAMTNGDLLIGALTDGMPVYIDTSSMVDAELDWVSRLGSHFELTGKAEHLYELRMPRN